MDFISAVKTVFKKYAVFKGRATRSEYWWFWLFSTIVGLLLVVAIVADLVRGIIAGAIDMADEAAVMLAVYLDPFTIVLLIFAIVVFIPTLAVEVRRLHDIGRSGYWLLAYYLITILLGLIPNILINTILTLALSIIFIVAMCRRGEEGENQYGPNPLEETENGEM
ncbi:MAG: DUF805 domain-containing protein [Coprobacter sp.]|nr:DUF805 domain-containing protein [Coprobacter sp.]